MSAEAVSALRQDILETLKNQFSARLDSLVDNSREEQVSDADVADLKDQYLVSKNSWSSKRDRLQRLNPFLCFFRISSQTLYQVLWILHFLKIFALLPRM